VVTATAGAGEELPALVNRPPVIRNFAFVKRFADEICKGRERRSVIKILAGPDFNGNLLRALMGAGSVSRHRLQWEMWDMVTERGAAALVLTVRFRPGVRRPVLFRGAGRCYGGGRGQVL